MPEDSRDLLDYAIRANPRYLDCAQIVKEYGFKRDTVYKMMRAAGAIDLSGIGVRKLIIERVDFERFLTEHKIGPSL